MGYAFAVLALLFPALILLHLLVAPYTKVEESFHVQAVHDILANGLPNGFNDLNLNRADYDHFSFPGAVPRSAVGAAVLAMLSKPVILLSEGINRQILARAILGLFNASALVAYARGLRRSFGQPAAVWYILLQASQFHLMFYASRPLSNMFAFGITTLAMRLLLPSPVPTSQDQNQCGLALALLTVAGVVFRSELALLVGTQTLFLLSTKRINLQHTIIAGLVGLITGLALTIYLDSTFWQIFPLWPEFEAFRFNVLAGQSSEWGTDPWPFYFQNALPRLLFNPLIYLLAIPVALRQPATRSPRSGTSNPGAFLRRPLQLPATQGMALHPALGAGYLWTHRSRSLFARLATRALAISTLAVFCLSNFVLLPASAANYPGGQAIDAMHHQHSILHDTKLHSGTNFPVNVYLGNLACQTGVTRFLQQPPSSGWVYDKTEDKAVKSTSGFWERFDYVVVEADEENGLMDADETSLRRALPSSDWERVHVVDSFAGISVLKPGTPATGTAERRVISAIAGARAVDLFEGLRDYVRDSLLRGWWVEVKMRPRVQVLRRVREGSHLV
ncbi:CAZyme family GT22 [Penicillium coprophilum]|uniref:CAZyme family GT22 n=1 Tax=Penicillium coprophilum TaxID=36646 RepID=UPI00239279D7|nr:CAZyme family GT22 [Penicillium coprophilum]KAJ5169760.1 CAZyme family GT22 [Penicillium coprophilum]